MRFLLILFILLFSFACGGGTSEVSRYSNADGGQSPVPKPAQGTVATATPTQKPPPTDENTELKADFEGTSGIINTKYEVKGVAELIDVRTGRHDGFDRIVFEFRGAEMPGYHLEYIDRPVRACGSGNVVPLPGDGWLQVRFEPAAAHANDGKSSLAFRELSPKLPNLLELRSTCDFEAQVEWVAGVGSPNHFRVVELKDPTRLAVDIKHK